MRKIIVTLAILLFLGCTATAPKGTYVTNEEFYARYLLPPSDPRAHRFIGFKGDNAYLETSDKKVVWCKLDQLPKFLVEELEEKNRKLKKK